MSKLYYSRGIELKILVTGGAGFIGSALVRHIIDNTNNTVLNLDKLTYAGNLTSIDSVSDSSRYNFEQADISDRKALRSIFERYQPQLVIHLAAESHVDRSIDAPEDFIQTNIIGTYSLLEESRRFWSALPCEEKNLFRFHHVSTDEVYGDLGFNGQLFTEQTRYDPTSPYSASKAASDHLVRSWYKTYKLPTLVSNCSNNYGPYQFPEKLIPLVIQNALAGQGLPIYGAGDQVRDWLFVEDHAQALYLVATKGIVGETYNIGGHNEKTNLDVVTKICQILDNLVPLNYGSYGDQITYVADRPGHDRRYAIDASKIANELDWVPNETFDSGLQKTVLWYIDNQEWSAKHDI